eukprot:6487487-Amphidinium_carterae.1
MGSTRRVTQPQAKTVLMAFENERGVQDPVRRNQSSKHLQECHSYVAKVGFFDPLGFTADGSLENFKRRRQTEIKHGRVAMLATM